MDNKKQIRRRILIFTVSVLFLFSLFAVDLFRIQIVNAADYSTQRVALSETKSTIAASRGEILDCNGTPLVTNEQINSVVLNASYFPSTKEQDKRNEIILSLINLLESEGAAWNDNLPLVLNSDGSVSFKENADKDITYLKSKDVLYLNSYATAQNCYDAMVEMFEIDPGYSLKDGLKIAAVRYQMLLNGFGASNAYTFAQDVSDVLVAKVKENSATFKGVDVEVVPYRRIVDGTLAAHIIGTVGKINAEEYAELKDKGVWVFGTTADGTTDLYGADLKGPAAIVIGSEGSGMTRLVSESCDFLVSIPMKGRISSLNASAAAAILLYEAVRQRG